MVISEVDLTCKTSVVGLVPLTYRTVPYHKLVLVPVLRIKYFQFNSNMYVRTYVCMYVLKNSSMSKFYVHIYLFVQIR